LRRRQFLPITECQPRPDGCFLGTDIRFRACDLPSNRNAESDAYAKPNPNANSHADPDTDRHPNPDKNCYINSDADSHPFCVTNSFPDADAIPNIKSHANTDAIPNIKSYANADAIYRGLRSVSLGSGKPLPLIQPAAS